MLKNHFILLAFSLLSWSLAAQCPAGNVFLNSQADVDQFLIDYPTCTELPELLRIDNAGMDTDITDLSALSNLTIINGSLVIENNPLLTSFAGLENMTTIGEQLIVDNNDGVTSLSGLDGISTVGTNALVAENDALTSLDGLEGLMSAGSALSIRANPVLTNIDAIANFDVATIPLFVIQNNTILSECAIQSVCTIIADNPANATISGNAAGCANQTEVEAACAGPICPEGDVVFLSQAEVDAFVAAYPNCTTIGGNLFIGPINSGTTGETTDITDISGLISITSVQGSLAIEGSPQLTSLQGVNAITTVGSSLVVRTMTGLSTIDELSSITTMNGFLAIDGNTLLTSIDGIENITPSGIGDLFIVANPQLSSCAIDNVCAYLASMPTSIINISNNAAGCNSVMEVETACDMIGGGDCPEGNVTFTTQAEVDAFVAAYPNCDMISGNLRVGLGAGSTDISDLSGLNSITNVTGLLAFFYNDQLTSLTGLESLTRVGEGVYIYRNNSISSLVGLDNLSTIGGKLDIFRNDNMTSLMGLSSVVFVGGELRIRNNTSLATTEGLNALAEIGGYFAVQSNSSLENLDGLESLVTMNSFVSIRGNASLTNIEGMVNINPAGITKLHITDNSLLSECAIDNVCAFLATAGSPAQIANNAGKCSSRIGVEESCAATDMLVADTNEEDAATSEATKLTSIETSSIAASVKLFPNPTSGLVQIRNIEAQRVTIFNPQGQRMAQYNTPTTELDMSTLPAGVYYLSFETAEGRQTERVVKVD